MPVSGHASAFLSLTLKSAVMICGGINRVRENDRQTEIPRWVSAFSFPVSN